jgi:REP element-mobilizing transposase RayT
MRKTEFANGEYYHIYNRGVDKREVFLRNGDYKRFIVGMNEFNCSEAIGSLRDNRARENQELSSWSSRSSTPDSVPQSLVQIIAYCLNSNHYHLILRQVSERGVEKFMHKLSTGYTNYFNKKSNRTGALFQGRYKSTHIDSNEYLLHLSVYVNANHVIHNYPEKDWPYSSCLDYAGKRGGKLCEKETILGQFDDNPREYEKFMRNNINYFREKKELEKYILE